MLQSKDREWQTGLEKKTEPTICCLRETHLRAKDTYKLNVKGWKRQESRSFNTPIRQTRLENKGHKERQRRILFKDERIHSRYIYIYTHIYIHTHRYTIYIHTYIHYIDIYIHTYIHTYIHLSIYTPLRVPVVAQWK